MAIIEKKSWPASFKSVKDGAKRFEVRVADFRVKSGDILVLKEWNPRTKRYTGRSVKKRVRSVFRFNLNDYGQKKLIEKKGFYVIQL